MKRGGLGRGLSALLPGAVEEGFGLLEIPVEAVAPNPRQPRTTFEDEALEALALSIREVGVLQPIVVRKAGNGFELIAGGAAAPGGQARRSRDRARGHPGQRRRGVAP